MSERKTMEHLRNPDPLPEQPPPKCWGCLEHRSIVVRGLCKACKSNPQRFIVRHTCAEPSCSKIMTPGCVVWMFTGADESSSQCVQYQYCKEHFDKLPPRKSFEEFEKEKQEGFQPRRETETRALRFV